MATERLVATSPHRRAAKTAEEIGADAAIVICDPGTEPEALPRLPDIDITVLAFDDVDHEDANCGQPFSQQDARRVLEALYASRRGVVVTCPGGVSRSAAVTCALWAAGLAEATDEPFGRNAANAFTCPNRLVFDTCLDTWGTVVDKRWADEMFERNVREHLRANADDKEAPTFEKKAEATETAVMAITP